MTVFMLICLLMAKANGLYVPSECWTLFSAYFTAAIIGALAKAMKHND